MNNTFVALEQQLHSRNSATEIVFIDANVADYQMLANKVALGIPVVVLDANRDGITQITEALQIHRAITAIHLVTHGAPGCLWLGNGQLSLDTLHDYAPQLQHWFAGCRTSTRAAELLLYGCNVAAGDAGGEFIDMLHQITGANIAAS